MEGVGARLGRSSTRYGPATVFTGPVRKWKKKWVPVPPSTSNHHHHAPANGAVNGSNGSAAHLLLYKWTAIIPSQNKDGSNNNNSARNSGNNGNAASPISNEDDAVATEEPPRRKFKYIPVIVLEEQKNELSEHIEDEAKPNEIVENTVETTSKSDGHDAKPDINDEPMNESKASKDNPLERHDLNESTLELSLGFEAHKGENDAKADQVKDDPSLNE